jgi:uncharacterized protein YjeT (DUF2065 family)
VSLSDLAFFFGCFLVVEGILPFLSPETVKRAFPKSNVLSQNQLRFLGFLSMMLGLTLVYVA